MTQPTPAAAPPGEYRMARGQSFWDWLVYGRREVHRGMTQKERRAQTLEYRANGERAAKEAVREMEAARERERVRQQENRTRRVRRSDWNF